MPTIRAMIDEFPKGRYEYNMMAYKLIEGNETYSLINQEEIGTILDKNVIKSTPKDILSQQIKEAFEESFKKIKRFNLKVVAKMIYNDLADFLNRKYRFTIDMDFLDDILIGSPEERALYLLRETERMNTYGQTSNLTEIAAKLGCSRRSLEKDVQQITEQGFKLLGLSIELVDENNSVLKMESTPHPIIMMQNITQIMVMLEGLRAMERINAYHNYAQHTAITIWNQLTEYTQNSILDALERINEESDELMKWYLNLERDSKHHQKFLSEMKNSEGNFSSQIMYLTKNQKYFNLTYKDHDGNIRNLDDCIIERFHISESGIRIKNPDTQLKIDVEDILEIDIL
ncbi:MAG: hypothetical protein KMY55_01445 [Dethiosulfatibacter sp.]|nr:hypothetical protein [Dethiosulfatibacter sp.]